MKGINQIENGLSKELIKDYETYCRSNPFPCNKCNTANALHLIEVNLSKVEIVFTFQCDECANIIYRSLDFRQLEYLALRFLYHFPDDKSQELYSYFRMFRMLLLYDHLLKSEVNKKHFKEWYERIEISVRDRSKVKKVKEYMAKNGHTK